MKVEKDYTRTSISWLSYDEISSQRFKFAHFRKIFTSFSSYSTLIKIIGLATIYFIGINISLPYADISKVRSIESSSILIFIDKLFSGGALINASPLALGMIPLLLVMLPERFRRSLNQFYEYSIWSRNFIIASIVGSMIICIFWSWLGLFDFGSLKVSITIFCSLILGSIFVAWLDKTLLGHGLFGLLTVNVFVSIVRYYNSSFQAGNLSNGAFSLGLLLSVSLVILYINQRRHEMHIVNIKNKVTYSSTLYIYWSDLKSGLIYIFLTFLFYAPILIALSLFLSNDSLKLASNIVILLITTFISNVGIRSKTFDVFMTVYSPAGTSKILRNDFWVIPGYKPGATTSLYIYNLTHRIHKTHYLVYGLLIYLLCLIELLFILTGIGQIFFLGPIGMLVVAVVFASAFQIIGEKIKLTIRSINYANFWVRPSLSRNNQMSLAGLSLEEILDYVLRIIPEADRSRFYMSIMLGTTPQEKIRAILKFLNDRKYNEFSLSATIVAIIGNTLISILLASLFTAILIPIINLLTGEPVATDERVDLLFFWVPTFLGLLGYFGVYNDGRNLYIHLTKRDQDVKAFMIFEEEDIMNEILKKLTIDINGSLGKKDIKDDNINKLIKNIENVNQSNTVDVLLRVDDIMLAPVASSDITTGAEQQIPESYYNNFLFKFVGSEPKSVLLKNQNVDFSNYGKDGGFAIIQAVANHYGYGVSIEEIKQQIYPHTDIADAITNLSETQNYFRSLGLVANILLGQKITLLQSLCSVGIPVIVLLGGKISKSNAVNFNNGDKVRFRSEDNPEPMQHKRLSFFAIVEGYSIPQRSIAVMTPFSSLEGNLQITRFYRYWQQVNQTMLLVHQISQQELVDEMVRLAEMSSNNIDNASN